MTKEKVSRGSQLGQKNKRLCIKLSFHSILGSWLSPTLEPIYHCLSHLLQCHLSNQRNLCLNSVLPQTPLCFPSLFKRWVYSSTLIQCWENSWLLSPLVLLQLQSICLWVPMCVYVHIYTVYLIYQWHNYKESNIGKWYLNIFTYIRC